MSHSTVSNIFKGMICVGGHFGVSHRLQSSPQGTLSRGVSKVLLDIHRTSVCMPPLLKNHQVVSDMLPSLPLNLSRDLPTSRASP